jgi:hypothetical protein
MQSRCSHYLTFRTPENPDQTENHSEGDSEEYDSTVAVQSSTQVPGIDSRREHGNREDSQSVLGHRQRNRDDNDDSLPPRGSQEKLSQYHGRDQQHRTGADTAALLRDLDCEARNREQDAILCDRNADCREECVRRQSRPSLQ